MTDIPIDTVHSDQLHELNAEQLRELCHNLTQQAADYRTRVRERAIQGHKDKEWPLDRLNDALTDLGLPTYEPKYVYSVPLTVTIPLHVTGSNSCYHAESTVRSLDTDQFRTAIHEAADRFLAAHPIDGITLADNRITVHAGYAIEEMV